MFKFIKKIFILILIIIILVCSFITYEGYSMYKEVISKESIEKKVMCGLTLDIINQN